MSNISDIPDNSDGPDSSDTQDSSDTPDAQRFQTHQTSSDT